MSNEDTLRGLARARELLDRMDNPTEADLARDGAIDVLRARAEHATAIASVESAAAMQLLALVSALREITEGDDHIYILEKVRAMIGLPPLTPGDTP